MRSFALGLAACAALTLGACGGESDGTFDFEDFPFTFTYPEDFEETDEIEIRESAGATPEESVGIGIDENDGILVQSYPLPVEVTERNLPRAKPAIDDLVRQLDPEADPTEITELAGRPALVVDDVALASIEGALSRLMFFFDGDQEYLINCQSTPDHRDEVAEACEMAEETLSFE